MKLRLQNLACDSDLARKDNTPPPPPLSLVQGWVRDWNQPLRVILGRPGQLWGTRTLSPGSSKLVQHKAGATRGDLCPYTGSVGPKKRSVQITIMTMLRKRQFPDNFLWTLWIRPCLNSNIPQIFQLCEPINCLFCLSQFELSVCYFQPKEFWLIQWNTWDGGKLMAEDSELSSEALGHKTHECRKSSHAGRNWINLGICKYKVLGGKNAF